MLMILTRHEKPYPQVQVSFNINPPLRPKQKRAICKYQKIIPQTGNDYTIVGIKIRQ